MSKKVGSCFLDVVSSGCSVPKNEKIAVGSEESVQDSAVLRLERRAFLALNGDGPGLSLCS